MHLVVDIDVDLSKAGGKSLDGDNKNILAWTIRLATNIDTIISCTKTCQNNVPAYT